MEVSEPGADGEDVKNTAQLGGGSFGCGSLGGVGVSGVGCSDGRAFGRVAGQEGGEEGGGDGRGGDGGGDAGDGCGGAAGCDAAAATERPPHVDIVGRPSLTLPPRRTPAQLPPHAGLVNNPIARAGCLPSFGAFGSAQALCKLLGAVATGALLSPATLRAQVEAETAEGCGERRWLFGLQQLECHGGREPFALGLHTPGGSVALVWPRSQVSVAILLNDCQPNYAATKRIIQLITHELKLGHLHLPADSC